MDNPKKIARLMLKTIFSTTLRIFLPVTILFLIGLAVDLNATTKPWGMLSGTMLGIIIAIALVIAQLNNIKAQNPATSSIDATDIRTSANNSKNQEDR